MHPSPFIYPVERALVYIISSETTIVRMWKGYEIPGDELGKKFLWFF